MGDLERNFSALLRYLVLSFVIVGAYILCMDQVRTLQGEAPGPPGWLGVGSLLCLLLTAAAYSAMQAILLAEIGEEIDRPLWKYDGPADALRRFFMPWFLLNLSMMTLGPLLVRAAGDGNESLALLLQFALFLLFLFLIPIGASVVHHGQLNWGELSQILAPIVRMFPLVLIVMLLGFVQFCIWIALSAVETNSIFQRVAMHAPFNFAAAYLDCLAFATMWRICILHRNLEPEDDDEDYMDF